MERGMGLSPRVGCGGRARPLTAGQAAGEDGDEQAGVPWARAQLWRIQREGRPRACLESPSGKTYILL